jgi:hypothetical protein
MLLLSSEFVLTKTALTEAAAPSSGSNSNNPNVTALTPEFFTNLKSQRVRVKYGPHKAPSGNVSMGMKMFLDKDATMPCSDCLITWMKANLEYPDGTTANADTGMWLHHAVLLNTKRKDTVCGNTKLSPQRFFASGNERSEANLSING